LSCVLHPNARREGWVYRAAVAAKRHSLTIEQTFRKILASDQAGDYYDSVRDDFLGLAAQLVPRVDKLLERAAADLGTYDPALPVVKGEPTKMRAVVLPADAAFPVRLALPVIPSRGGRRAYHVTLVCRRKPGMKPLQRLFHNLWRTIQAHENAPAGKSRAVKLRPVVGQGPSLKVTLTPTLWAAPKQASRLSRLYAALAAKLRKELEARLGSATGVTLAPYSDRLGVYGDSGRLPGRLAVGVSTDLLQAGVHVALKTVAKKKHLAELRRELYRILARGVGLPAR
jgi:hypothetical protein